MCGDGRRADGRWCGARFEGRGGPNIGNWEFKVVDKDNGGWGYDTMDTGMRHENGLWMVGRSSKTHWIYRDSVNM